MSKDENDLSEIILEDLIWKLRRMPMHTKEEYQELAYKFYQAFGFDNASELITNKYGTINYYLFGDKKIITLPLDKC